MMMSHVSAGDYRRAVQEVAPLVPQYAEAPAGEPQATLLDQDPDLIRSSIAAIINRETLRIGDLDDPDHRAGLIKAERYALLSAVILPMHSRMVEGDGTEVRFRDAMTSNVDPRDTMGPIFTNGLDAAMQSEPWVANVSRHYDAHHPRPVRRSGDDSAPDHMRSLLTGTFAVGAYPRALREIGLLAAKLQEQRGEQIRRTATDEQIVDWYQRRRIIMHSLAYLGVTRAGLHIYNFTDGRDTPGLHQLDGTLAETETPDGQRLQVFRRGDRAAWEAVFPTATDGETPQLKCPAHAVLRSLLGAGINRLDDTRTLATKHDSNIIGRERLHGVIAEYRATSGYRSAA